jgi:potassium voltage-gated channel Shaw-related subfamily C protein 1
MIVLSITILWISSYNFARYQVLEMSNDITDTKLLSSDSRNSDLNNVAKNTTIITFRLLDNEIHPFLIILDYITFAWFLVDITVRMIVAPSKSNFFHNLDNVIDIVATSWLIIGSILKAYFHNYILEASQVVRVLRLFRLLSYHSGLQVIITSIKMSGEVLQLLVFVIVASSVLYGSLIFYAERLTTDDPNNNLFISIPNAFWYSLVSLTTIGYGDLTPITTLGRLFGSACVVTGVLMVGLPMTIVVEVFTNFYNHLRARSKLPKQRRRVLPVEAPRLRKPPNQNHHHRS